MLNKEECIKALRTISSFSINTVEVDTDYKILEQLINEHFDNSVCIEEGEMFKLFKNRPLKFEELHVNMWIWDCLCKDYVCISGIDYYPGNAKLPYIIVDNSHIIKRPFVENRFYRREVKQL